MLVGHVLVGEPTRLVLTLRRGKKLVSALLANRPTNPRLVGQVAGVDDELATARIKPAFRKTLAILGAKSRRIDNLHVRHLLLGGDLLDPTHRCHSLRGRRWRDLRPGPWLKSDARCRTHGDGRKTSLLP